MSIGMKAFTFRRIIYMRTASSWNRSRRMEQGMRASFPCHGDPRHWQLCRGFPTTQLIISGCRLSGSTALDIFLLGSHFLIIMFCNDRYFQDDDCYYSLQVLLRHIYTSPQGQQHEQLDQGILLCILIFFAKGRRESLENWTIVEKGHLWRESYLEVEGVYGWSNSTQFEPNIHFLNNMCFNDDCIAVRLRDLQLDAAA
ncbi:hypothetical protein GE09DRAFT_339653 [Coniochaeta sp. 2T2.1]|nr:hypothetical protein GE09DRAFT_339653 [Coniochaeta sp. 2T2.1]